MRRLWVFMGRMTFAKSRCPLIHFPTKSSVPILRGRETPDDYTTVKGVTYHHPLVMKIACDTSNKDGQQHASFASFIARITAASRAILLETEQIKKRGRKKRRLGSPSMFDQRLQWEAFWSDEASWQPTRFETAPTSVGRFIPLIAIHCQG
jgi:hypothetical protein